MDRPFLVGVAGLILGAALGWLSLLILPDVIAKWPWLRITLLFVSPLFSGLVAYRIAIFRRQKDSAIEPIQHFWWSWAFAVGLVVMRFTFAIRPRH